MLGQNHHFNHFAPRQVPFAIERFQVETQRLYGVLNRRLGESPWRRQPLQHRRYRLLAVVNAHQRQRIDLASFPAVHNWFERIRQRPATVEALLKTEAH